MNFKNFRDHLISGAAAVEWLVQFALKHFCRRTVVKYVDGSMRSISRLLRPAVRFGRVQEHERGGWFYDCVLYTGNECCVNGRTNSGLVLCGKAVPGCVLAYQ